MTFIPKPPPKTPTGFKYVGTRTADERGYLDASGKVIPKGGPDETIDRLTSCEELTFCICDLEPTEDELATRQCAHCGKVLL